MRKFYMYSVLAFLFGSSSFLSAQNENGTGFPYFVDFTKGTKVKVTVWSPKVGAKILYKMEDSTSPKDGNGNPTIFVEVEATTTVANSWQVLTFDLTSFGAFSTSNKYDRVILFPDFGVNGTGATYYFDDIKQSN